MKKILLLILLTPLFCSDTRAQEMAAIRFVNKDSVYDFGSMGVGDQPKYQFEIKNTGDTALIITEMKSETGDFKFEWPKKPLKPHKKALIYITYHPKDPTAIGSFKSDVFITSNATQKPYPYIHVSGTVLPSKGGPATSKPQQSSRGGRGGRG